MDSVLLTWLAVIQKSLSSLNIHDSFQNNTEPIQTNFSIGRFLIICAQYMKSLLQKKWCPVVCQVHDKEDRGPYLFYLKSFFIKMELYYQLVYEQVTRRPQYIIEGDDELIWMVLHYPLCDLMFYPRHGAISWHDYDIILLRGYYYFLRRKFNNMLVQEILDPKFIKIAGNDSNYILNGFKVEMDKTIIDDDDQIPTTIDDETLVQPWYINAGTNVFNEMANLSGSDHIFFQHCGFGTERDDKNSLYLAVSQLIYGDRIYYLNIRQFLHYYYRSISMLPKDHPLYQSEHIKDTIFRILYRMFNEKIPDDYKQHDLISIDYSKCQSIYYELSQRVLRNSFPGDYMDLLTFGTIFGVEFVVCEGKSINPIIPMEILSRQWRFMFSATGKGDSTVLTRMQVSPTQFPLMYLATHIDKNFVIITNKEFPMFDDLSQIPKSIAEFRDKFDINEDNIVTVPATPVGINEDTELQDYLCGPSTKKIQTQYNVYLTHLRKQKYFQSQGNNKVVGSERSIGPMFKFDDFVNAKIPENYIMPITRCLDPFSLLVRKNVTPIEGEVTFKHLYHLRPKTWLCETSTKIFIDYLRTITNQFYFIDPATYSDKIEFIRQITRLLTDTGIDNDKRKDVILMLHLDGHFIIVEIKRSKTIDDNLTPVAIADSMDQDIQVLCEELHKQKYLNVFLHILGNPDYKIVKAEDVQMQTADTIDDCGIICLQRMYALALTGHPSISNLPIHLQSTIAFRCYVCYITLEHRKHKISPYIVHINTFQDLKADSNMQLSNNTFNNYASTPDVKMVNSNAITQEYDDQLIDESNKLIESEQDITDRVDSVFQSHEKETTTLPELDDDNDINDRKPAAKQRKVTQPNSVTELHDDNNSETESKTVHPTQPNSLPDLDDSDTESENDEHDTLTPKKTIIKFTIPQSSHGKFLRSQNSNKKEEGIEESVIPKRSSARINQRKQLFKEKLKELNIEDQTELISRRKRIRDPQNRAVGFQQINKKPKEDKSKEDKATLQAKLREERKVASQAEIDRKIKEYDKFVDCEDYDVSNYADLIDDLYSDEPFVFVDQALAKKKFNQLDRGRKTPIRNIRPSII